MLSQPIPDPPYMTAANAIQNIRTPDLAVASDGSINFVSAGGTEVFRPPQQAINYDWLDSVLGMQHRYQDPVGNPSLSVYILLGPS